jgi:hypothetical protein
MMMMMMMKIIIIIISLLGRPRHRWKNNIRMDLGEMVWVGVDWMHLAQGREK